MREKIDLQIGSINPVEHWISVLRTRGLPDLSYRFAREALTNLKRFDVLERIDAEQHRTASTQFANANKNQKVEA